MTTFSPSSHKHTPPPSNVDFLFGILGTVIVLVSFVSLVFLKTMASNEQANITQQAQTHVIPPTLDSISLTQNQGGNSPMDVGVVGSGAFPENPTQALLTAGTQSDPLMLEVHFTDLNGVLSSIKQAGASVKIVAAYGSQQVTDCAQAQLDGTSCWQTSFDGMDERIWADTNTLSEDHGTLSVPMAFPYFAKPGVWSVYVQLIPVDESGVAQPSQMYANTDAAQHLRFSFGKLVAITVSPATVQYVKDGVSLAPQDVSDPESITVISQGNVPNYVSIYGDAAGWSCDSGQTMSVSVTHLRGGTGMTYGGPDAQTLRGGEANKQRITQGVADWTVPVSTGAQDGVVAVTGENSFETMIQVPVVVGTCSTVATVLGEDASSL